MFRKIKIYDVLILLSAILSLVFSETLWFRGEHESAIFTGLWVPSILGFGVYVKLLNKNKND